MILTIIIGAYIGGVLLVAGMLIGDEVRFENPKYGKALASAIVWPIGLLRVVYQKQ